MFVYFLQRKTETAIEKEHRVSPKKSIIVAGELSEEKINAKQKHKKEPIYKKSFAKEETYRNS